MIKIGSRESELALWQAQKVKGLLENLGLECQILKIKSTGDIVLDKPLYELGVTGIFTKSLDLAVLSGDVDIAVHSMKDVPTLLPGGISELAVLKRGDVRDVLVKGNDDSKVVATGSLRRKAQWLSRYPDNEIVGLRGNVNSRMQKLDDSSWRGAIFAKSGLERIGLLPKSHEVLDWMVPAPAQGALMVVGRSENSELAKIIGRINDDTTQLATGIERAFLRTLEGGCTAPIGALAEIDECVVSFTGVLNSLDGSIDIRVKKSSDNPNIELGVEWANELLSNGGKELMVEIKKHFDEK